MTSYTHDEYRKQAIVQYSDEATLGIAFDYQARVRQARGNPDGGAYVAAWVWVADEDINTANETHWRRNRNHPPSEKGTIR